MELLEFQESILGSRIIPIGIIKNSWNFAWSALSGNSVSGIVGILRILELILRILVVPKGIIPIPRTNFKKSNH